MEDRKIEHDLDPALLARAGHGWRQPSHLEVRELQEVAKASARDPNAFSGAKMAALVGSDGRTWRRWTSDPETTTGSRKIPYAVWRLFLVELGLV